MAMRYGFFDSEITGVDSEGMPIFDRAESSDFLAMFLSRIISDGVLAVPGDCFQVVADEGMKLKVKPGFGFIRGRFAANTNETEVELAAAPSAYKRIDRVVLRVNYLQRLCEIIVKTGTPDASPVPPELLQTASGDYYELCLATVVVNANQTVITQTSIKDKRYSDECGIVTQAIDHLDTSTFSLQLEQYFDEFTAKTEAEFMSWFNSMKDQLSEDAAGYLLEKVENLENNKLDKDGDTKDNTVTFSSSDTLTHVKWEDVQVLSSGEKHSDVFGKISKMFKNVRYLLKKITTVEESLNNLKFVTITQEAYNALSDKDSNTVYLITG